MSIEKYLKDAPDYTIPNTAWASTDNQNLRLYKLSNAGEDNIGIEWCYSTNFNNIDFNDNTYSKVYDMYGGDTGYKTGIKASAILPLANGRNILQIDDTQAKWDKITGGLTYGLVYYNGDLNNAYYNNIYICSNVDYSRVALRTSGWDSSNNTTRKMSDGDDKPLTDGMGLRVMCFNPNTNTFEQLPDFSLAYATMSDDNIATLRIYPNNHNKFEAQVGVKSNGENDSVYVNQEWELPWRSDGSLGITEMFQLKHKDQLREIFTIPQTKQAMVHNIFLYRTYYGGTYCFTSDVKHWITFLNSTGLRYYDGNEASTTEGIKANTYMGIMDEDGITDSENRIKGWDEIEQSDLPNKDRNGYDWDVVDPTKPPTPKPTDDDDIDDMGLGVGRNYSGMVKYYRLDPAQLLLFSQEIQKSSVVPEGYDIMKNIIALKRFPVDLDNYAEFSEAELIKLGSVTVPLSASQLAWEKKNISLGTYTIQGYHGTKENPHFLDFSPYTTAEVFIPYCGFVTIPTDKIMYNEIEVRLLVDVKLGNCTGVVKCNGNIVGEKSGVLCADIPLVAVNMGVAMGAITQGLMDTTLGFVSAIPYASAGNVPATFSGVLNGASALTQTIMSSKKNYTEVIGTTGGDIMFTMPDRCYIKITYPKKELPSNYGKMVGYMCGKGGRLGDFSGFTICENVHVNVKATEEEKQMILEKLLTGVIMPYNG